MQSSKTTTPHPRPPVALVTGLGLGLLWTVWSLSNANHIVPSEIDWLDVMGEGMLLAVVLTYLAVVGKQRIPPGLQHMLEVSLCLVFIGGTADLLDEFVHTSGVLPSLVENGCLVLGFLLAGIVLVRSSRIATEALQDVSNLQRIVERDALTGLANRRAFDTALGNLMSRPQQDRSRVSLALFDIDHFKQLNDQYGHATGDRVLREFGSLASTLTRGKDVAFRVGGEEFGVLFVDCAFIAACSGTERIRYAFSRQTLSLEDGRGLRSTLSAGVTAMRPDDDINSLYRRADQALYAAKAEGRNRVVSDPIIDPREGSGHSQG